MKKLLFIQVLYVISTFCSPLILSGCAKKLELGMAKVQSMSIMGKQYVVDFASRMPEGNIRSTTL